MEMHKAETLVRTGPGTPMGNLLRRYWEPVLAVSGNRGAEWSADARPDSLLELDGEDLRDMPLGDRKKRLARLLGSRRIGLALRTRVPHGSGGHRVEAAERALQVRPDAGLGQDQEPGQPGDDPGSGSRAVS
jgi:hypothetical protein